MSWFSTVPVIGSLVDTILRRVAADKDKVMEAQNRVNELEISGAPASRLRLWRSFLGWTMAVLAVWEFAARPCLATYFPAVPLPPSFAEEILSLLFALLGFGL